MNIKKIIILNLLFLISTGCLKNATETVVSGGGPVSASGSTGSQAKWESYNIDLKIATNDGTHTDGYDIGDRNLFISMGNLWETAATGLNFFNFGTTTNKDYVHLDDFYDSEMGIYRNTHWFSEVSPTALAITQYFGYRSGSYISLVHADVIINESGLFAFTTTNPAPAGHYDLPSIVLHELGHFLGLSHNLTETSVMRPSLSSGTINRTLSSADTRDIKNRYGQGVSGLSAGNAIALEVESGSNGSPVRGILELNADGNCKHYENGRLIHSHRVSLK